jgi:hypothetical protein
MALLVCRNLKAFVFFKHTYLFKKRMAHPEMPKRINFPYTDDVRKVLRENGFSEILVKTSIDGHFDYDAGPGGIHTPKSLRKSLKELCKDCGIGFPKGEFMSMFYALGNLDSDKAFFYTPGFKHHSMNSSQPSLRQITSFSRGLTKILPWPLIAVCEEDRFKIPKIITYQDGKVIDKSRRFAGKELYHPDFHDRDEKKMADNFKRSVGDYVGMLERSTRQ